MKVLVIGGAGPTDPFIVGGLLERSHQVTVMHSRQHHVMFSRPIERIRADVHFDSYTTINVEPRVRTLSRFPFCSAYQATHRMAL